MLRGLGQWRNSWHNKISAKGTESSKIKSLFKKCKQNPGEWHPPTLYAQGLRLYFQHIKFVLLCCIAAPKIFPIAYSLVKPFLNEVTRSKVKILGGMTLDCSLVVCLKCKSGYKRHIKPVSRKNAHTFLRYCFCGLQEIGKQRFWNILMKTTCQSTMEASVKMLMETHCADQWYVYLSSILKDIYLVIYLLIVFLSTRIHVTYFKKINKNC